MDDLARVLARIEDWPVDHVGIGVTSASTTLGAHGTTGEVLRLASVTKLLTAYTVLLAVQDGAIHLDEPAGPADAPPGVTVRHLLAHTSGLAPERGGPINAPGRRRIYSNWGFEELGALVEQRTGLPFAEQLDLEVLRPLGMGATFVDGSPAHAGRGTVDDLLAFARELMAPTLLEPRLHAAATSVAFPGLDGVLPGYGRQSPCDWGLGLELKSSKQPHWTGERLAPTTFGHFGRSGSFLWVDPTRGLATVELADRDFGDWAIERWPACSDAIVAAVDA